MHSAGGQGAIWVNLADRPHKASWSLPQSGVMLGSNKSPGAVLKTGAGPRLRDLIYAAIRHMVTKVKDA
jgi:hypothetical protein